MTNLTLAFNLAKLVNEEVTKFAGFTIVSGDNSSESLEERLRKVIIDYLTASEGKVVYALDTELLSRLKELVSLVDIWIKGPLFEGIKFIDGPPALVRAKEVIKLIEP